MTTPNQPAPDGAYVIGGAGNSGGAAYGQEITDKGAAQLMLGGFTSIAAISNPLDAVFAAMSMFADQLLKLPLEVLKLFEPMIPGDLGAAFNTVGGAVNAIIGFFQGLGPLLTNTFNSFINTAYNVLNSAFHQILDIINGLIVTPINSAVQGVKDWFAGLMNITIPGFDTDIFGINALIQNVINTIWSALRGLPIIGGFVPAMPELAAAITTTQVNQQNAVISNDVAGGYRNPSWVCRYPIADVTFPEVLNYASLVQGATGAQSTGAAHTHTFITDFTAFASAVPLQVAPNTAVIGIITMTNTGVIDTIATSLRVNPPATTINNVFVELLRIDDVAGTATIVASVNVASSVPAAPETYIEASVPGVIAQAGERYLFRVRNSTTNGAYLNVNSIRATTFMQRTFGFASAASGLAANTTYNSSQLTTVLAGGESVPWGMAAVRSPVITDQSFSDDFNRKFIGALWFPVSNTGADQIGITDNQAAFNGTTNGDQLGLYIKPVADNEMLVEANLHSRVTTPRLGVMSCCNRDLTQTVYLGVNAGTANLYTGAWNSLTQRKTVSVTTGDAKWGLYNDPSASKFYIMRDGTDVDSWTDTGGVVQLGADYRYGGIRTTRASGVNAGTTDNFTLRDFTR